MTTWCPGNCDSPFLTEQKPPRSRWSRFWKVTFRRSETKWITQQGCHSEEKGYCMFGGQQEVRYLELSPYSLTLPPKMLTSLISWPQLNKLLMVRPQHASHRGVGGVRGMWHSRMSRPQSEEWSMLDVGAVSWALASRIDLHAMPIYMWHQRYNGTVEISPVEELQRPMGISSDLPCFNMSSLRHCWWYQCTKVCHSLTEEFQQ